MLKVVGASTWKTRLSSFVLGMTLALAILLLLIVEFKRPEYNGIYCATAYWSPKVGFRVEFWGQRNDLATVSKGVARACYKDGVMSTGWGYIEIETQADFPDRIQAFAAGILEGALTWAKIYDHWSNTIEADCEHDDESQKFCGWAREILEENYDNIKQEAEIKGHHSHYWYQVWLYYQQLAGLEFGWELGVRQSQGRNHLEIPEGDFFLMNAASDLKDLKDYYGKFIEPAYTGGRKPKTGALFMKLLNHNDSVQMLLGHSSGGDYASMLRMHKHYNFRYHFSAEHKTGLIPSTNISFTGYPGTISSADDFYWINGKWGNFVIGGIRIENENKTVWEEVVLDDSTILGARIMAANRLAYNGRSWCKYMSHKSGTGNKQWLLVDTRRLQEVQRSVIEEITVLNEMTDQSREFETRINDGEFIWIADQVPGKLHFRDVTEEVTKKGYWFSNGLPYLEETLNMSVTNNINHSNQQIVDELQQNVTTLTDLTKLFITIGYRGDLESEPQLVGNIDLKLFDVSSNATEPEILIKSGPVYDFLPLHDEGSVTRKKEKAFSWSGAEVSAQHSGQPDLFEFGFVRPGWAWLE